MKLMNMYSQRGADDQSASLNSFAVAPRFTRRLGMPMINAEPQTVIPLTLLLLTAILSTSMPANGDVKKGQFEVGPFAGYHFFENDQNLKDNLTYGIRFGYSFTPKWAIEGALSTVSSEVDDSSLVGASEGEFRSPTEDVDLTLYQVDALYHFRPENKFSPYLVGGFGSADYSPSISSKEMSTFNVGVGAKYWIAENFALRFEMRNHLVSEVFEHSFNNISATVGASFAFGGSEPTRSYHTTPQSPSTAGLNNNDAETEVVVLKFEDIHFDFDKSTLTNEAKRILQRSTTTLQNNPNSKVRIAGYTSAAGTEEHNQGLSERRATAIKNYLIKEGGIAEKRLSVIGYGSNRPATHESSPENMQSTAAKENMRALFEIVVE